jgi:hypothetical protein
LVRSLKTSSTAAADFSSDVAAYPAPEALSKKRTAVSALDARLHADISQPSDPRLKYITQALA